MTIRHIKDEDLSNKIIILRADLNVPTNANNDVTDTSRIDRLKPTIDLLHKSGAITLILSHFGRPKGKRNMDYSLSFLPETLSTQWGHNITFCPDCIGPDVAEATKNAKPGDIILLENCRFHPGEEENNEAFAQKLAHPSGINDKAADFYINDAFSVSHRAHASTFAITKYTPSLAGLLMMEEITALNNCLETPQKPVTAIIGGSKISTKLDLLYNLVEKTDNIVLGGGMANTFLAAKGVNVGKSLKEDDMLDQAVKIMDKAQSLDCKIILPIDATCAPKLDEEQPITHCDINKIPEDLSILDIGPKSIDAIKQVLQNSKTILWNGPVGAFETKPFENGSMAIANEIARLTKAGKTLSVAGGGDTLAAIEMSGTKQDLSYVSTAGGAFLEWLEGKELPGIVALHTASAAA